MKNRNLIFIGTILTSLVVSFFPITNYTAASLPGTFDIKTAQATSACPDETPFSYMVIREGDPSGRLLGSYSAEEPNPMQSHSLNVDSGTVLWVYAYTEGVEIANEGLGSRQYTNLPVTVTTPNIYNDPPRVGGYKPSGYNWTRQQQVVFTSDSLTSGGMILVAGDNACDGDPGLDTSSSLVVHINVGPDPNFNFVCDPTKSVTRGQTATYQVSATALNGFSDPIDVTMTSSPSGPVLTTTPVVLTSPGYLGDGQINTTGLSITTYDLTFTATSGSITKTCLATLVVRPSDHSLRLFFDDEDGNGPQEVPVNSDDGSGVLSWEPTGQTACIASMAPESKGIVDDWNGPVDPNGGTFSVTKMNAGEQYIFRIDCTGDYDGSDFDESIVDVGGVNPPTVDIKCFGDYEITPQDDCTLDYNHTAELSWTSGYSTSCEIDQKIGAVSVNGSRFTTSLTSSIDYVITCTGPYGQTSDTTRITVNPPNEYFTMSCSPALASPVQQTQSQGYVISARGYNGFATDVTISMSISSGPSGGVLPNVTYNNPLVFSGTQGNSSVVVNTDASTVVGYYILDFTGTGGGKTVKATCDLEITPAQLPEPPTNVRASNDPCQTMIVSWDAPISGQSPTSYRVYHSDSLTGTWTPVGDVSAPTLSLQVPSDTILIGKSNYYRATSLFGTIESAPSDPSQPQVGIDCGPGLTGSDKDLINAERGKTTVGSLSAGECNGSSDILSVPNNDVFRAGDSLTFTICVRNSGTEDLKGVSVNESKQRLNLDKVNIASDNCGGSPNGESWSIDSIPVGNVCVLTVTANILNPGGAAGLYRFKNVADISAIGAVSGEAVNMTVSTPPYVFAVGSGTPIRNETAP